MMSDAIKAIVKNLIRLAVLWLVDALSLAAAAWILPGLIFTAVGTTPRWIVIVSAALLLALVNLLIRPIVLLIARPLGWVVLLVVGFLVNALAIWITAALLPGFEATFWGGITGGIVIAFFNAILTGILEINDEGSWYQNRIQRMARQQPFAGANEPGRGLMMVEIDGLSYWHLQKALDDGLMPTLQAMIDEDDYRVTRVED
jgi:putative membrane protein